MPKAPLPITSTPTPVPQRSDRATFKSRVDGYVTWITNAVAQFGNAVTNCYNNALDAYNNAVSAASSNTSAASSSGAASTSSGSAATAANHRGKWSTLTGALSIPSICTHKGLVWVLNTNTTDVTLDEPGVSTKWSYLCPTTIALARQLSGSSYQNLLGAPCSPTLDLRAYDYINEPNGCHPSITFSRASAGTRYNHLGNVEEIAVDTLRHDYDPLTGEYKGWLLEIGRTNLLTYSEQLDNAAWAKVGINATVTADNLTAPNNTLTADKLTATVQNSLWLRQTSLSLTGTAYSFSGWTNVPSANGWTNWRTGIDFSDADSIWGSTYTTYDNWEKVEITKTLTASRTRLDINLNYNGALAPQVGSYNHLWGLQLEQGSFPTSYIKTTSAAVARAADSAIISGSAFTDFFNTTEGTILFIGDSSSQESGTSHGYISVDDGTVNNMIGIYQFETSGTRAAVVIGGVITALGTKAYANNSKLVAAIAYKNQDHAFAVNGELIGSNASVGIPSGINRMLLGMHSNVHIGHGHIERVLYFPKRLNNELLKLLTEAF